MAEQLAVFGGRNALAFRVFMDVPSRPAEVAARHHNRFAKLAMRETLEYHHKHHIPLHYKGNASKTRYNYMARSAKYEAIKRRQKHHDFPLVYSGKTSKQHRQPGGYKALRVGGAAEGGKRALNGTLEYAFSFAEQLNDARAKRFGPASRGKPKSEARRAKMAQRKARQQMLRENARRRGVTIGQMRKELEQMTQEEVSKLADVFLDSYTRQYNQFKAGRKRNRRPTT